MFPVNIRILETFSSKQNYLLKVMDESNLYMLKISRHPSVNALSAYRDEFLSMQSLCHPCLPIYYGIKEDYYLKDSTMTHPALCMEYCDGDSLSAYHTLSTNDMIHILVTIGDALQYLLDHGILYTDLHPDNILLCKSSVKLIDFTYSYCFGINNNPSYTPKISYQLDQRLPAQQLLIQALTLLAKQLFELNQMISIPYELSSIIQTGMSPHPSISLIDFIALLRKKLTA